LLEDARDDDFADLMSANVYLFEKELQVIV
jgi:hypothetical protein